MKQLHLLSVALGFSPYMASAVAIAQPAPGASAPRSPGMGMGGAMRHGPRLGPDNTTGWSLMTAAERDEHREQMRSAKTHDECVAALEQHRERMLARAREKGTTMPARPRRDACAYLKN